MYWKSQENSRTHEILEICCFSNLLGHKDRIQIEIWLNNSLKEFFGLKIKILEFYSLNRARYPIYDEIMQNQCLYWKAKPLN